MSNHDPHSHNGDSDQVVEAVEYDEYRFDIACKECGVVDSVTLSAAEATQTPMPVEDDPARHHYERTEHTVARVCYTKAPVDIQEMLNAGSPEDLDWPRIAEWLANQSTTNG